MVLATRILLADVLCPNKWKYGRVPGFDGYLAGTIDSNGFDSNVAAFVSVFLLARRTDIFYGFEGINTIV